MKDHTRRRPPQGTIQVIEGAASDKEIRRGRGVAAVQALASALERADPQLGDLQDAMDDRDDQEIARLVRVLRDRYGAEVWDTVARVVLVSRGRWISRRRR